MLMMVSFIMKTKTINPALKMLQIEFIKFLGQIEIKLQKIRRI